MFNPLRCKTFVYFKLKGSIFTRNSPSPIRFTPLQIFRLPFSLEFISTTSDPHSFTVSYLVNNCGFSSESAIKASKLVRFQTSEKPDSVLNFFKNHGFSNSHIHGIISRAPALLLYKPDGRVLSKFEFFLSKGSSTSDIVLMVTRAPRILLRSLQNHIIPSYVLLKGLLQSDEKTIACIKCYPNILYKSNLHNNVALLRDSGVTDSNIARYLATMPSVLGSYTLRKTVEEIKQLGFDPSKTTFCLALLAKQILSKSRWDEKVDTFKKWGWSEETVLEAFRRQPHCMLKSTDKINAVMNYWVNQLGWDSLDLARGPEILGLSLEKRIIPRASVVQFLLSKGLRKKNVSLVTPFFLSEELFLRKFVNCFKQETPQLLKLYQEKMNLQGKMDKGAN